MLNTYINFKGNCREAFEFYRSVFDGEFAILEAFRNGPQDMGIPEEELDNIMHVSLPIGDSVLMGSDTPSIFEGSHVLGTNISISVSPESKDEANRLFGSLSEGGSVAMPMADMFWGSYFGACTDKFGINSQINYEQAPE